MSNQDENNLISKSRKGDKDAFGRLIVKYADYLFSVVFRIVLNKEEAEDIVQEAYVKAWMTLKDFDASKAKFSTWLYCIASRKAIDFTRTKKSQVKSLEIDQSDPGMDIHEKMTNKELEVILLKATDGLSEQQRIVFVLRDLEDLDVDEVVAITGYSKKKIKDNLFVARKKIRSKLSVYVKN